MLPTLEPIEIAILGVAYSVPNLTYRVPSCRRKYAVALASRDPQLVEYNPKHREMRITPAGVDALRTAQKNVA